MITKELFDKGAKVIPHGQAKKSYQMILNLEWDGLRSPPALLALSYDLDDTPTPTAAASEDRDVVGEVPIEMDGDDNDEEALVEGLIDALRAGDDDDFDWDEIDWDAVEPVAKALDPAPEPVPDPIAVVGACSCWTCYTYNLFLTCV